MKYLLVMRHGNYNRSSGNLTDFGKEQIKRIAEEMKTIIGEIYNGHYLLSSSAPRSKQSAKIIANFFGLEEFDREKEIYEPVRIYSSKLDYLKSIDNMIAPHIEENDIVTIVSHYYVVNNYPRHIVKTLFQKYDSDIINPEMGEGILFAVEAKTHQMLPRR